MANNKQTASQIWSGKGCHDEDTAFLLFVRANRPKISHEVRGIRSKSDLENTRKRVERDEARKAKLLAAINDIDQELAKYLEPRAKEDTKIAKRVKDFLVDEDPRLLQEWAKTWKAKK